MAFDMNIAEAAAAPRVHHQWLPDRVLTEPGISPDTLNLLESMGHNVEATRRTLGRTNSIQLEGSWRYGYSDLRRPGGFVARPIP
jgi:gamma-glutamyltranspeptidase/glutathione hydrolase